jgi:putative phosphoribosyl transferase
MRMLRAQLTIFRDRADAAMRMAVELKENYGGRNPLILAIPRGGVPVGRVIASELNGELDVVLVRKISAPHHAEFAVGSVDERGKVYVADYAHSIATPEYIMNEASAQLETIKRRRLQYTPIRSPINPANRVVIVVDDGLATGATMLSALESVRAAGPERLVCAVPVASLDGIELVERSCDEVMCLYRDRHFQAVGLYYAEFNQVEDSEAINILRQK